MKPAVQVKCPRCQNLLRVPPDMGDISLKCKHCGNVLQLKKKAKAAAPVAAAAAAPAASKTTMKAQATTVRRSPPMPLDDLPEYIPPAPIVAPLPLDDDTPAAAQTDYNPAFERAGRRHTGRGTYKGPRGGSGKAKWIAVGSVVMLGIGIFAAVVFKPEWFKGKPTEMVKDAKQTDAGNGGTSGPGTVNPKDQGARPNPADQTKPIPRRMLTIGITNYLYMNPLQYGSTAVANERERKDFYKAMDRMASGWRVPKDQQYYLTDGPLAENRVDYKHPPLKMVIEGTIDSFLKTSRSQDRIIIVFSGHAVEKEGEAYLVPLEGEMDEVGSLIPLKDFYAKLAACPAQEKLIIYDVCRFDVGTGVERPMFGPMTEGLEKALHHCPEGTTVWTSCSAGQFSYENALYSVSIPGLRQVEMWGSVFASMFILGDLRADLFKKRFNGMGIHHPADPLPVSVVAEFINEKTAMAIKDLEKKDQTPKITSKARKEWLPYNPDQPLAQACKLTDPPPTAKREEVVAMFKEINLPGLKSIRKDENKDQKLADSFPFQTEHLKDYYDNGPSFEEVQKNPEKYEKTHPLRLATVDALVKMRGIKQDGAVELPEEFKEPINDMTKKTITDKYQRTITTRQGDLEDLKEKLEEVAKKKDAEKSKRWVANFDFTYAQVRMRLAYIYEYNLALAKVKGEQLPELDKKLLQIGWRLSSVEKMISPKDIRDMADEAKKDLSELVTNNPNTP